MESLQQRRALSSVTVKRRKSWLLAASALASSSLGLSEPALALDECGALVGGSATCTSALNPYATGIGYNTNNTPINVTLQPGPPAVQVNVDATVVNAVSAFSTSVPSPVDAPVTLSANDAAITHTLRNGPNQSALIVQASGDATITASGVINVTGTASTNAVWAIVFSGAPGHVASVNYDGPGITATGGANSTAIQACANSACGLGNQVKGNAIIEARGNITVIDANDPNFFRYGLLAKASAGGDASVHYGSGTINVSGSVANGIQASSSGDGSATVITDKGTTINVSSNAAVAGSVAGSGVIVLSSATAASGRALTANVASTITSVGPANLDPNSFPIGILAQTNNNADAPIFVTYTGPGITTKGGNGSGIAAFSGGGNITINSFGPINTTDGSNAIGISADSGFFFTGPQPAMVTVNATDVLTMGQFGTAISATAGGNVAVDVASGGSVMGGWQADLTSVGQFSLVPAAGVILGSSGGTATLTNNGSIGALSDRAVASSPFFLSNNTSIINNGTITGFVQLVGGNNSFVNNGLFNLRHFADTTGATDASGNGVRDTLRVAIADLGTGPNNSFTNNGLLALPAVTGATTLDSAGQYLPLGNPNNAMALNGPLQGHLIGVGASTFINSGVIDLQSNPVAGDVLVITGARAAGVPGTGTFISNGGTLRLDTVLNEGGAATRSDTLVVDGTLVGGGATTMAIRNVGGTGALTVGDGILVTQVLDPARSAAGAFSLQGGSITAGAFDYFLFKGGPSPGSEGNWYLRSSLEPGGTPAPGSPPLPTLAPGAAPIPLFQPGVAVMSVMPSVARTLGLLTLGTFNERQGDQLLVRGDCSRETQNRLWTKGVTRDENCTRFGAWGRVFGQNTREHFAQGARPDFDGTFAGFQAGADLWRLESINGHRDNIGFYVAQARASGSVHGVVDGFEGALAGHVDLDASSFGGYWTHLGPSNWYIDTVVQGTHFYGTPQSIRGISTTAKGDAFAGSIEAGYPITLAPWLSFEPQIQGIWQRVWLYDTLVPFSTISFDRADVFTGRAGALLRGTFGSTGGVWQPYLKGNVWWGSNGFDTVTFNSFGVPTGRNGGTTLEGGAGITGKLTRNFSVYGDASYLTSVSGESHIALKGNVGLRVTW